MQLSYSGVATHFKKTLHDTQYLFGCVWGRWHVTAAAALLAASGRSSCFSAGHHTLSTPPQTLGLREVSAQHWIACTNISSEMDYN